MNTPRMPCFCRSGRVFEIYCEDHGDFCCTECVSANHSSCKNVSYLNPIDTETKQGSMAEEDVQALRQMRSSFEAVAQRAEQNKLALEQQRKDIIKAVQDRKALLYSSLTNLVKTQTAKVNLAFRDEASQLEKVLEECRHVMSEIEVACTAVRPPMDKRLQEQARTNDREFVESVRQFMEKLKKVADEILPVELLFQMDEKITNFEQNIKEFGQISAKRPPKRRPSLPKQLVKKQASPDLNKMKFVEARTVGVRLRGDKGPCWLTGVDFMSGERIAAVDRANGKLKIFCTKKGVCLSFCSLSHPWGVAVVGKEEVAVTLPYYKKIQFVRLLTIGRLVATRCVNTEGECYGIVFNKSELLVANDTFHRIQTLNLDGQVIRTIQLPVAKGCLRNLAINSHENIAIVTVLNSGILSVYKSGEKKKLNENLKNARGISCDKYGSLVVCTCSQAPDVSLLRSDGTHVKSLLRADDGLHKPYGIWYSKFTDTHFVATRLTKGQDDVLKEFKLK